VYQVYEDLYNPSNLNDPNLDTNLSVIIQAVFPPKEHSRANAIWTQAVIEVIFDENYLSMKLDNDIIE